MIRVLLAGSALLLLASGLRAEDGKPKPTWTQQLQDAVEGCDHIRVRHGDTIEDADADALFEVKGTAAVSAVVAGIEVDDARSAGFCSCMGHPRIDFYRKGKRVVELSFHHGLRFRWSTGPWLGDEQSRDAIRKLATELKQPKDVAVLSRAIKLMGK